MQNWIKCSERMPPEGEDVLVYDESENSQHVASWSYQSWVYGVSWDVNLECYPTHWQPLPEPPRE